MSTQPGKLQLHHLPAAIAQYIDEHFPGGYAADIHEHQDSPEGISYQVNIVKDEKVSELFFAKDGKLLRRSAGFLFFERPGEEPDKEEFRPDY